MFDGGVVDPDAAIGQEAAEAAAYLALRDNAMPKGDLAEAQARQRLFWG